MEPEPEVLKHIRTIRGQGLTTKVPAAGTPVRKTFDALRHLMVMFPKQHSEAGTGPDPFGTLSDLLRLFGDRGASQRDQGRSLLKQVIEVADDKRRPRWEALLKYDTDFDDRLATADGTITSETTSDTIKNKTRAEVRNFAGLVVEATER